MQTFSGRTNLFGHAESKDSALLTSSAFDYAYDNAILPATSSFYLAVALLYFLLVTQKVTSLFLKKISSFSETVPSVHFDDSIDLL